MPSNQRVINHNPTKFFIVGTPRSGTKIYQHGLNNLPKVKVYHEMHFLRPKWIGKDTTSEIIEMVDDLKNENVLIQIIRLIVKGSFIGSFWKSSEINKINKKRLYLSLASSRLTSKSFIEKVLNEVNVSYNSELVGVRASVHSQYIKVLRTWFPNSKILCIIRDPRAVYTSLVKNHIKQHKSEGYFFENITKLKRLIQVLIIYKMLVFTVDKFKDDSNFMLVRYEDCITDSASVFKKVCNFLDIEYSSSVLNFPRVDSSYQPVNHKYIGKDVDESLLNKWQNHIGNGSKRIIDLFLKKEIEKFGYSSLD